MIIGVTASQEGLTEEQEKWAGEFARQNAERITLFVDGECIGGDTELCLIFRDAGVRPPSGKTRSRPCTITSKRSFAVHDEVMPVHQPLIRNHHIIDDVLAAPGGDGYMLCFPRSVVEIVRSGTWATIRAAHNRGAKGWIIWPNGSATPLQEWEPHRRDRALS